MNIAAEIKNTNKKSNYVVSLSFDIPIKSARSVLDKPISGQFTITPSLPKKNFKLKIGQGKSVQQTQLNHEVPKPDSYRPVTSRNEKKSLNKSSCKNQNNTTRHSKNLSFSHSKSPSCIVSKPIKQNHSLNETLNMKAIKKKMLQSMDEDITGYTNSSSELRKQEQKAIKSTNMSFKNTIKFNNEFIKTSNLSLQYNDSSDSLLRSEIRKIENSALQKKQRMNNEYIKRRIIEQASARKIQRAWRNYKTKKLIHTYSQTLSMKFKKKEKDGPNERLLSEKKVLNVKSCDFKNGRNEMKRQIKEAKLNFFQQDVKEKEYEAIPQIQIKKQLQIEEIKKWEELIKELRKNKNVHQVLEKAEERKKELMICGERQKIISKEQNGIKKDEKLLNTINRIQNEDVKLQIQKTMDQLKKINIHSSVNNVDSQKNQSFNQNFLFEDIHNEIQEDILSQKNVQKLQISPVYLQKLDLTEQDQIQEKQLVKKRIKVKKQSQNKKQEQVPGILQNKNLENFKKFRNKYMEKQYELSDSVSKPLTQQSKQDVIVIKRQKIQLDLYNFNRIQELLQFLCYTAHEQFSTKQQEIQNLLDVLLTQIICQFVLQLKKCKNYSEIFKNYRNHVQLNQTKQSKPEGICTNMESIKDYLQNMVAFVLDQSPNALLSGLNTPGGYDSLQILRTIRKQNKQGNESMDSEDFEEEFNFVLPKAIFKRHWQYASQQIYFEKKFDDRQKQIQRTRKLKQITKVYFQAIFDCFNECLNHFRSCGIKGAKYPWQIKVGKKPYYVQTIDEIKPLIKMAFKKLSEIATVFCGLLIEDKKTNISLQLQQDIREERMNIFLEHEIQSYNYKWSEYRKQEVEVLCQTSSWIQERLILQLCLQFIQY